MSLNMMGLGFSFGVEDLKLKDFQASVSEGFIEMSERAASAVDAVKPFVPSFEGVVPQIDAASDAMTGFGDAAVESIERAGDELKRGREQWTEFKQGVTDTVEEWKGHFTEIGTQLKEDVTGGFERVKGAVRGLYQETGLEQVGMAMGDLKDRAVETGTAIYKAADAAFGISRAVGPVTAVARSAWEAAKGFLGMRDAAEAATRAASLDPEESTKGVQDLDKAVQQSTETFDHDLPVAMEAASRSFHKESTRMVIDTEHIIKMFKELKSFGDSLKSLVSLSKLQTVFQGIGTGLLAQISRMKSGIGSLLQANVNLTTSLEAEGVQFAKSAKAIGAQRGLTGSALRQFTGEASAMASSLNMDASTTANALAQFNWAQKEFAAIGITSAKQLAKAQESLGIDSTQLAGHLRRMRKELQFGDKDLSLFVGGLQELGREAMDIPKAVGKAGEIIESLGGVTDRTGQLLRGEDLAKYQRSTVAAMRGFYAIYQDLDKASALSLTISKKIGSSREEWHQLFTGAGEGFPELQTNLMRMGVNVDHAFAMMQTGPEGFTKGMAEIAKTLKKQGKAVGPVFARLRGWMAKSFDPEVAQAFEEFAHQMEGPNADAILAGMEAVKITDSSLGKLADESHSTGRTLQESFDRMKEAGVMGFRAISRASAVAFVGATGKEFQRFNKRMQAVAAGDGPLAGVVKQLSLMHQIGAYALVPEALRPMAVLFGEIGNQVLPLLGSLAPIVGGLAPAFIGMSGPMMAVSVAAGALVLPLTVLGLRMGQLMIEGKTFGQALDQLGKDIQNFANTGLDKLAKGVDFVYEKFSKVDWKALFSKVFKAIKGALSGDFDLLGSLFGGDQAGAAKGKMSDMAGKIKSMVVDLKDAFVSAVEEADWGSIAMGLLDKLVYIFIELPNKMFRKVMSLDFTAVATGIIERLSESFAKGGEGAGNLFVRLFSGIAEMSTRGMQLLWKALSSAFMIFAKLDWGKVLGNVWEGLKGALSGGVNAAKGIGEGVWNWLKDAFAWVVSQAPKAAKWLQTAIPKIVDTAVAGLSMGESFVTKVQDWVLGAIDTVGGLLKKALGWLWKKVPGWIGSVVDWFSGIKWMDLGAKLLKGVASLYVTVMSGIPKFQAKILDTLVSALTWVLEKIPPAIDKYLPKVLKFVEDLPNKIEKLLSGEDTGGAAGGFVGKLFGKMGEAFSKFWPVLVKLVTKLIPALVKTVVKLVGAAVPLFLKLMPVLYNIFGKIWDYVMDTAKGFVVGLLDTIKTWLQKKFPSLAGPIGVVFKVIEVAVKVAFTVFKWFWKVVIKGFEYLWKGIGFVLGLLWDGLKLAGKAVAWVASKVWKAVKAIGAGFAWMWGAVKKVFTSIYGALSETYQTVSKVFKNAVKVVKKVFATIWWIIEPVVTAVYSIFKSTFDMIWKKVVEPVTKWVVDKFTWIWNQAKRVFKGIYDTVKSWFDKVYLVVSGIFTRIKQMWDKSWGELKKIMKSWFTWVQEKVDAVKTKLKEVFEGLKEKAEKAMEGLRKVLETPFNMLKGVLSSVWDVAKSTFLRVWSAVKVLINGIKALVLSIFRFVMEKLDSLIIRPLREALQKFPSLQKLLPKELSDAIMKSAERAKQAMNNFSLSTVAGLEDVDKKVKDVFVKNTLHHDVEDSASKATKYMDAFARAGMGDVALVGDEARRVFQEMAASDMTPQLASDVLSMAVVQPWMHGSVAADYYAKSALDAFGKVAEGSRSLQEVLGESLRATAAVDLVGAVEDPVTDLGRADRRRRDLEQLALGPMKEVLAATNNPAWYSDWRATFLKAHEDMKATLLQAMMERDVRRGRNARGRPMPARDLLADLGMDYGRETM